MSFLTPAAFILGVLAIPIVLLYMLRLRRREQTISSTMLWRQLIQDQAANMPWQKLRRNLLMLLQLLLLALLVIALARPYIDSLRRSDRITVILLDGSASMQAIDIDGGFVRFDSARDIAGQLVTSGSPVTIIQAGKTPTVLATTSTDTQNLRQVLAEAIPGNESADWPAAFSLAAASVRDVRDPRFIIISDGGLPENLPDLPGEVEFIQVGQSAENLAITAMASRPITEGSALLVAVENFGPALQQGLVSIYEGETLIDSKSLSIGPGERVNLNWDLSAQTGIVEARLEQAGGSPDYLPVDNSAWASLAADQAREVLLISDGNLFLERLFQALPGYKVTLVRPDDAGGFVSDDVSNFDLIVFDGVTLPDPLPNANILVFNPQPVENLPQAGEEDRPIGSIDVTGSFTDTAITAVTNDPLLENVDLGLVSINQAQQVSAPGWNTLVQAAGGPLLLTADLNNRRAAMFTFDLRQSDLPLQIAFPIIMANITSWLSPGRVLSTSGDLQPGDIVTLTPNTQAEAIIIEKPDGNRWVAPIDSDSRSILFGENQEPGIYSIYYENADGQTAPAERFVVNFFNREESRIRPADSIQIGQTELSGETGTVAGRREIWPWILAAGWIVLLVEWWISHRRISWRPRLKFR